MIEALPGNPLVTFVIDQAVSGFSGGFRFLDARFNRAIGTVAASEVLWVPGVLTEPTFVAGSTKAGVELLRPQWTLVQTATALGMTNSYCSGKARSGLLHPTDARWNMKGCFTWRALPSAPSSRRVVGPPFVPAQLYSGPTRVNLCP